MRIQFLFPVVAVLSVILAFTAVVWSLFQARDFVQRAAELGTTVSRPPETFNRSAFEQLKPLFEQQ